MQFVFLFLCGQFSEKRQWDWASKLSILLSKNKSTTIFYGVNSHQPKKRRQNVQNFAVKPLAVPLEFEHFDIIAKVNKSTDHGKMMSICYRWLARKDKN